MKKFTRNFIIIMFAGIFIMTMLVNDFFASDKLLAVWASENTSEMNEEDVSVSVERLSPDEIDIERAFTHDRMGNRFYSTNNSHTTTSFDSYYENITTVTTQLPGSQPTSTTSTVTDTSVSRQSTTSTTRTTVAVKNSNDMSDIKNPNYQSPYYIVVYTGSQSVVVYGKDSSGAYSKIVKSFTCSTGNRNSTPTRKGVYAIRAKYRWRQLMGGVYGQYSSSISSSYLFHSVPYASQDPSTLYDASYNNLGKDVSHGCIRLCVRDCKWIYDNAPIGTQVNVVWTSGPSGSGVPQRKSGAKYSGWDPSDQWAAGNPYFAEATTTSTKKTTTTTKKTTTTTQKSTTTTQKPTTTTTTNSTTTTTTRETIITTTPIPASDPTTTISSDESADNYSVE